MLGKLRSLLHLTVATLFGLGGASAAVLTGEERPASPPQSSRDAEPEIVLAEAKTVQATGNLKTFLELYAGPVSKPVVAKPPPKKKAVVKSHRHKVTKKVVKVQRKKAVVKRRTPSSPFLRPGNY
jgi:hypothetical protein